MVEREQAGEGVVVGNVGRPALGGSDRRVERGVGGTFHAVGKKYMRLYVAGFQVRYNNRVNLDIFGAVIRRS